MDRPPWFPDWTGQPCAIVAGGESVTPQQVDALRGRCRVAVVNNSHELAPWADILYAADGAWWNHYPATRAFDGIKVTCDVNAAKHHGLQLVTVLSDGNGAVHDLTLEVPGTVAHGGHSGFQLLNLVLQFGSRRIGLVGFDMKGGHWHGKHPEPPLRNTPPQRLEKWRATLDGQAARLHLLGAEVLNCSPDSALTAFRRVNVEEMLAEWERAGAAQGVAA